MSAPHGNAIRRRQPFTLLELVLAVAIFALLALAAGAGVSGAYRSWQTVTRHRERLAECQTLDTVVGQAFANAVLFQWPDRETKKPRTVFLGNPNLTLFPYRHRVGDTGDGGLRFLLLRVADGQLKALYRQRPFLPWDPPDDGLREETLARGVDSVAFRYADRFGKGELSWTEDWDEANHPGLPLAIQLEVRWQDGQVERWLRRTAGSGLRESLGARQEVMPK